MHTAVNGARPDAILPSARQEPRSTKILARSLYRDMNESGLSREQVLAVASELIGMVTDDLKAEHDETQGNA